MFLKRSSQIKGFLFNLTLIVFFNINAYAQEIITLPQALELSFNNNIQLKQANLNESLAGVALKESKFAVLPTASSITGINLNLGRSVDPFSNQFENEHTTSSNSNINITIPIFQGFQRINQISLNKLNVKAEIGTTKKIRNDLSLLVTTTYLQVLNYQDILQATQDQLNLIKQQLEIDQKQFNVGYKAVADISQVKAQVANAELNFSSAENQLNVAFLDLAQLMDRDPEIKFRVVQPIISDVENNTKNYIGADVYKKSVELDPAVRLAKIRTLVAAKAIEVAKGGLYPRMYFQYYAASGYSSAGKKLEIIGPTIKNVDALLGYQLNKNFNQTLSVVISIPIFNSPTAKTDLQKAKINYQDAQYSEHIAESNFNKIIYQAIMDLKGAEARYESVKTAYQAYKDAFYAIQKRYNIGLTNSLDFNSALTNLNKTQFEIIQSRYDLIFKKKIIQFYLGDPISF